MIDVQTDLGQSDRIQISDRGEELQQCEEVIQKGLKSFMAVGNCLVRIRDKRLYRGAYTTFEDYCRSRWGISRPYAYKLMAGAKVVEELSEEDIVVLPENANQVRQLTSLPKKDRIRAWKKVVHDADRDGVPITAKLVQKVVSELRPELSTTPTTNKVGVDSDHRSDRRACFIKLIDSLERAIATGDLHRLSALTQSLREQLDSNRVDFTEKSA